VSSLSASAISEDGASQLTNCRSVEALVGTLRGAKKRKIVRYDGELLLQGVHDDVDIVLLQE
jgi:hypothetical protein